ncbi:Fic family protein [Mycobacterium intracellulare]|uniref:Fic/DOC family protein n=1 Tax=Mycobacterium intracellulare TaxID=1767 RepID=UPI001CD923C4|nr:Fic family protein [Mycobacterium intracellulare]MCA2304811.1 Fic family protein [Mycobacterium intracellulare]MCA2347158.1 Fic family protein [Mycobacterium intracellulare]
MAWADYFWPDSTVLRNKLGITDAEELRNAEYRLVAVRQAEITRGGAAITETFDAEHLKSLHGWLFQDVYDWAGRYRDVAISKLTGFAPVDRIDDCLDRAAGLVSDTRWQGISDTRFAHAAAEVFAWVNYAHPFREGNGRASRAFMDAVAVKSGRWLDYSGVSEAVWVQRTAFSVPDLDQDRPQHHWLVPVFAAVTRHQVVAQELPELGRARERDSGYDVGL